MSPPEYKPLSLPVTACGRCEFFFNGVFCFKHEFAPGNAYGSCADWQPFQDHSTPQFKEALTLHYEKKPLKNHFNAFGYVPKWL